MRLTSLNLLLISHATAFLPERGKAREEYYKGINNKKEEFGINKRHRRINRGIVTSLPDGSFPK